MDLFVRQFLVSVLNLFVPTAHCQKQKHLTDGDYFHSGYTLRPTVAEEVVDCKDQAKVALAVQNRRRRRCLYIFT